jgi:O-6-methylguanine DNA methyltransferase
MITRNGQIILSKQLRKKIYVLLKQIPTCKVTTYNELAKTVNIHPRIVGRILSYNNDFNIPCFKVIKSDGSVGGYSAGVKKKIELLEKDGIVIKNRKIDLKKYLHRF